MVELGNCWSCKPERYDAWKRTLGSLQEGSKAIGHLSEEHPTWVARLQAEGRVSDPLVAPPPIPLCMLHFRVG